MPIRGRVSPFVKSLQSFCAPFLLWSRSPCLLFRHMSANALHMRQISPVRRCLRRMRNRRASSAAPSINSLDIFGVQSCFFLCIARAYVLLMLLCTQIPQADQEAAGLSPGYVRISIGFTGALEQRWEQLHDALIALKLIPTM
jgi:hypothetical protein